MCMTRADVQPGAYLTSPDGLFRVEALRPGRGGVTEVALTDERGPLATERRADPHDPGAPARWVVVGPDPTMVPMHRVLRDFELLSHGAHAGDTAGVEEYGRCGTAPT